MDLVTMICRYLDDPNWGKRMCWTAYIAQEMRIKYGRFTSRKVPAVLRTMEKDGLVTRSKFSKGNWGYEWALTDKGRAEAAQGGAE